MIEVKRGIYVIRDNVDNHEYHIGIEECEKSGRLWTIKDVKDGDVLAWNDSKCIAIFKNIYDKDSFNSYGFVGHCTGTFESRLPYHDIKGAHPTTKEQRDALMNAMADAGWQFDFEKKELKKIEDEHKNYKQQVMSEMTDLVKDYIGQKPSWTEDDRKALEGIIDEIEANKNEAPSYYLPTYDKYLNWLKSLKKKIINE